jgi:hypothetical protein
MPTRLTIPITLSLAASLYACESTPQTPPPGVRASAASRSDAELLKVREAELQRGFVIEVPPAEVRMRPVERVPRATFGEVGPFPLQLADLDALTYPSANDEERAAVLEGMTFFTTIHTAAVGAGSVANQQYCLGCHRNSLELEPFPALFNSISQVSRAARSTPTNFNFTSFDPETGGGRAADHDDALTNTGKTAAFTIFGDFNPSSGMFATLEPLGGFVQHTRPSVEACVPEPIPSIEEDALLAGEPDAQGVYRSGFRRTIGERAAPPYVGRGLIEAIPNRDILAAEDPDDRTCPESSLGYPAANGCSGDCISGRHNEIPENPSFTSGLGRFGLRANGAEILQFVIGGLQGELGLTSAINATEPTPPPVNDRPECDDPIADLEVPLSTPFSERNFLRNTSLPELGAPLLSMLQSEDPTAPRDPQSREGRVQRGAALFGVDLRAFANRMVAGRMPEGGDGLDEHAIDQSDRKLDCVSCHTPVQRTGKSPADVGARHLSYVWAPIFSDLLLHEGPVVEAERFAPQPRDPWPVTRADAPSFDLSRNLTDDAFSNFQAVADGREFRTAPLMSLGRTGPPFLHDARVYLSANTVDSTPASTVTSNSEQTNAPLVVRTLDDALRAAIELHDLPAPDDAKTPRVAGAGCPVPASGRVGAIDYGARAPHVVCPSYDDASAAQHRGEARVPLARFRALSVADQDALIAFLEQL